MILEREKAKSAFKKLAACYPTWKVDRDIAETWINELESADTEHVEANVKEYIRENKFPPSLADIIKPNQRIEAEREKEQTRKYIEQQKEREKSPLVAPPWQREGVSREEWMKRVIEKGKRS